MWKWQPILLAEKRPPSFLSRVVFLSILISALFLYFLHVRSYLKWRFIYRNFFPFDIFSYGRNITTNCRPVAVSIVVHYRAVNQLFYVGPDCFVICDVFLSVFGGSIVTIKMGMEHMFSSRRFDLFGPSSYCIWFFDLYHLFLQGTMCSAISNSGMCVHICVFMFMYVCVFTGYVCICICPCVHLCVCVYVCMCPCLCPVILAACGLSLVLTQGNDQQMLLWDLIWGIASQNFIQTMRLRAKNW